MCSGSRLPVAGRCSHQFAGGWAGPRPEQLPQPGGRRTVSASRVRYCGGDERGSLNSSAARSRLSSISSGPRRAIVRCAAGGTGQWSRALRRARATRWSHPKTAAAIPASSRASSSLAAQKRSSSVMIPSAASRSEWRRLPAAAAGCHRRRVRPTLAAGVHRGARVGQGLPAVGRSPSRGPPELSSSGLEHADVGAGGDRDLREALQIIPPSPGCLLFAGSSRGMRMSGSPAMHCSVQRAHAALSSVLTLV